MQRFECPFLQAQVELTDERRQHIESSHSDLAQLREYPDCLARVLSDPDQIRSDSRFDGTWLFARWFDSIKDGKYIVVAVVTQSTPAMRHWVVTAFLARRLSQRGEVVWTRS